MTWTLAQARRAAADVGVGPFDPEAIAAIRGAGVSAL